MTLTFPVPSVLCSGRIQDPEEWNLASTQQGLPQLGISPRGGAC